MSPEPFPNLDRVIHEKARLAIVSALSATPSLTFTDLRNLLGMTDGNLTSHLRLLQEAGMVALTKSAGEARPQTTCALTESGQIAFNRYLGHLEQIVSQFRKSTSAP
ncbi:MAG: transcriptional regulator [Verrucomicrobiota bacterium]